MFDSSDLRIRKALHDDIEKQFSTVGILHRVFSRIKSDSSLESKVTRGQGKYGDDKKIQDLFGVRVVLYFQDDIEVAQNVLKNNYNYDESSSTVDVLPKELFSATRHNLIFRLPKEYAEQSSSLSRNSLIDDTFEVQLRTVLSEGWHEVEHDLRYKCKEDWDGHDDLNRALNGIFASLESSEWGMMKLFEELSYRHYKSKEWGQMLRTKFRLRAGNELSTKISLIFDSEPDTAKNFFRISRQRFIQKIIDTNINLPINLDNLIYVINYYFVKSKNISDITPQPVLDIIEI